MRGLSALLPVVLLLTGCAGDRLHAWPVAGGLGVEEAGRTALLRLPSLRWESGRLDPPPRDPAPENIEHLVEAGGLRFAYGERLWLLDASGGRTEVPLPWGIRLRRAGRHLGNACASGCGGCLEIFGVLFRPSGPDPGLKRLVR